MELAHLVEGRRLTAWLVLLVVITIAAALASRRVARRPLRRALAAVSLLGVLASAAGTWAHLVEPRWIATTRTTLTWPGPTLRVALITDIHAAPADRGRVEEIVERTLAAAPDLVLLGGDFVDGNDADPAKLAALAPLRGLHARLGVLAVLGNHDSEERIGDPTRREAIVRALEEAGIRLLENEHVVLDEAVVVVGMGSWRAGESDGATAFAEVDERAPVLVLVHNFQSLEVPHVGRFDLALAGHTHAGQACVPFTDVCPWLEADMKPFRHGLYAWPRGGMLYVSAGLGTSGARVRIGARPEIALLDLRSTR